MPDTKNIKIVRLITGEDVVADIVSDKETTILNNPMVVVLRRSTTGSVMMMTPWLPVEVISDNMATINNTEIITYTNPRDNLIEYYLNRVETTKIEVESSSNMLDKFNESRNEKKDYIDNFLDSQYDEEEHDEYDMGESTMEDLLDSLGLPTDKKNLH